MKRLLCVFLGIILVSTVQAEKFDFVALGDTAYNLPDDIPVYERLIEKINLSNPAFSIHVGDTWGVLACTEENHRWVYDWFERYEHPVFYTPGDNEWTDCRKGEVLEAYSHFVEGKASPEQLQLLGSVRQLDNALNSAGYDDPIGSLNLIRKIFFSKSKSLGQNRIAREQQPGFAENSRWKKGGVVFATVSVPGSDMGFTITDPIRATEAITRNRANVEWLKSTFNAATQDKAKAVVVSIHASLFLRGDGGDFSNSILRGGMLGPYYFIALAIRDLSEQFGKPVLLINGDFHDLVIDRPFMVSQGEGAPPKYANITRLQVYGAPELKAVTVSVDTETQWVFSGSTRS